MKYALIVLAFMCSSSFSFAYDLTLINKTKSDIEIEYVICTQTNYGYEHLQCRENSPSHRCSSFLTKCDSAKAKFTVPAKGFVKNPFPAGTSSSSSTQNNPVSITYPNLLKISSLGGDFEDVKFMNEEIWDNLCGEPSEYQNCKDKYGDNPRFDINTFPNSNGAIIVDDEEAGFPHITRINRAGLLREQTS